MDQSSSQPPAPPPLTALRCQGCRQTGSVVIERGETDTIMLHCRACGARWSWMSARGCHH